MSVKLLSLNFALIIVFLNIINTGAQKNVPRQDCNSQLCITGCCPAGQKVFKTICRRNRNTEASIAVYSDDLKKIDVKVGVIYDLNINLNESTEIPIESGHLLQNGTLRIIIDDTRIDLSPDFFCVAYRYRKPQKRIASEALYFTTKPVATSDRSQFQVFDYFRLVALWISSLFLTMMLIVYCLLKELRNLRGLILMSCVASLNTALVTIAVVTILNMCNNNNFTVRRILVFGSYFSTLACFFWMNIMSLDIWWTFRGLVQVRAIHRRGELCKYCIYCVYAWGVPMLMTAALDVIDHAEWADTLGNIKPDIKGGEQLKGKAILCYMYLPIFLLLLLNMMYFILTVINISCSGKDLNRLNRNAKKQTNRLTLYIKLSFVMGINWFFEILSATVNLHDWVKKLLDIYNSMIGVIVFFIFVYKAKTFYKLMARYHGKEASSSSGSRARSSVISSECSNGSQESTALTTVCCDPRMPATCKRPLLAN